MIINCKEIAIEKKKYLREKIERLEREAYLSNSKVYTPSLAVIQIGDNPASNSYIKGKRNDCEEIGYDFRHYKFEEVTAQNAEEKFEKIKDLINKLNIDKKVSGIILQLPTPFSKEQEHLLTQLITPEKDVDGFGLNSPYTPCTPLGIMEILKEEKVEISGKYAVVIGRSDIVGKPVANLLLNENATVTICHSKTQNLSEITKMADIIVVATGHRNTLTKDMIKENCVIIDVGINRNEAGKLCGDVDFEGCKKKASKITPVPGGVGLMTRVALMENTYNAWLKQQNK